MSGHRFEAVWPVLDVASLARPQALIDEALGDLPRLALQARAELTGPARVRVRPGREVPGSGGATWVVHAVVTAEPAPARAYWKAAS